jgi:hypothetical protein
VQFLPSWMCRTARGCNYCHSAWVEQITVSLRNSQKE